MCLIANNTEKKNLFYGKYLYLFFMVVVVVVVVPH